MGADPEAEEREVQRQAELVQEDLRKPIETLLREIHQESWKIMGLRALGRTIARFASLLSVLSVKADKQATENLAMQDKVVRLTNQLYWITIALGLIAVAQIVLAYLQLKEAKVSNRKYQYGQDAERGKSKDNVQNNKK